MRINQRLLLGIALLFTVLLVGCGPSLEPGKIPFAVTVMYQGQPIEEAVVIFVSDEGNYANGLTDSNGVAQMGTTNPGDGIFAGKYQVAVDKSQLISENDPNDPTGNKLLKNEAIYHVPAKYSDFIKSGLTADVTKEGSHELTLELKD
ncbi:hypothetical protein DTL21_07105 [Bremerella cremea]|uniref:Carboxypeptidase regulatory-like domain-containing protein n=1 Tax=Blastopirellula marina TaxID=124 RepID=A0A2S8FZU4_9BACT|nr:MULTISPECIES: hypothetical protein [Pirellulaceae]PQO37706.1 hypothetical protein C5Y83_07105 [Blastopirellula marina]RCS50093.1 hypothetical protein DTL21_07105 [Bremerella cremea]